MWKKDAQKPIILLKEPTLMRIFPTCCLRAPEIASWEGKDTLTVWSASGAPYDQSCPPEANGLDQSTFLGSPVGASYGSKYMSWQYVLPAAALAKATEAREALLRKSEHQAAFTYGLGPVFTEKSV